MDDDMLELTYKKRQKQRRIHCIAVILALIVAFFIGFLIGFLAVKTKSEDKGEERERRDSKYEFQEELEDMKKHHMKFQESVSEEQLRSTLK